MKHGDLKPIALRLVKTLWSFGQSKCTRVKGYKQLTSGAMGLSAVCDCGIS